MIQNMYYMYILPLAFTASNAGAKSASDAGNRESVISAETCC